MKMIRWVFLFLFSLAITIFVLSFVAPQQQQVVKSITIQAPVKKVFEQMMLLQNFNNWSVWGQSDSSIRYTSNELPDGKVGATLIWEGNALLSGKGKIALTGLLENKQITHHITLLDPQKLEADSKFDLKDQGDQTTVTWTFTIPTKKPWNIYNLFFNLEKQKGAEFERGLQALKQLIEKAPIVDKNQPKITPTHFPMTRYVAIKQRVLWADLSSFFNAHFNHLAHYTLKDSMTNFTQTGLFYTRDEKNLQSDVAAALSIPSGYTPPLQSPEELVSIPATSAIEARISSSDPAIRDLAYKTLNDYIAEKKLKTKTPIIEEYTTVDSVAQIRILYLID